MYLRRLALSFALLVANAVASQFTIVIDAGSTGCRLYVYQSDPAKGEITGKVGPKVKPGLSTFTTHPSDLKEFISPLFIEAQNMVPQAQWASTPVHIKATAGMRLVTEEQARVIYDTVFAFLSSNPDVCPFMVQRTNLRTISGSEEGYFGALSANYLSGVIDNGRSLLHPDHAGAVLGALDLGGSSTQVSLHVPRAAGGVDTEDFFVHSYLGFGVEKMAEKYEAWASSGGLKKEDPCAPPGYANKGRVGTGNYGACKEALTKALKLECPSSGGRCVMDGVALPTVGPDAKFIGMSVYFFALRTVFSSLGKAGLPSFSWPSPSLQEVRAGAAQFCGMPWQRLEGLAGEEGWEKFMGDAAQRLVELPDRCKQAAYIDLLLGNVIGVRPDKHSVMIALEVNSMEVEWTLGSVLAAGAVGSQEGSNEVPEASSMDAALVFFSALLTLGVGVLLFRVACSSNARKVGGPKASSGDMTAKACPSLFLATKAALLQGAC